MLPGKKHIGRPKAIGPAELTALRRLVDEGTSVTEIARTLKISRSTAYAHCGSNWWSYDSPATIAGKMRYVRDQGLAGSFFWELSGDTGGGELITAIHTGLS